MASDVMNSHARPPIQVRHSPGSGIGSARAGRRSPRVLEQVCESEFYGPQLGAVAVVPVERRAKVHFFDHMYGQASAHHGPVVAALAGVGAVDLRIDVEGEVPPLHEELEKSGHAFDSNHNIVVDSQGNWISSLHSGHGGTPGYFFDGVEANGSGVSSDVMGPGRRQLAPLPASIVLKDGKPWLSLGTPGYPPQPVTEVLINVLEYGMDPKEAVEAVRFWQPGSHPIPWLPGLWGSGCFFWCNRFISFF